MIRRQLTQVLPQRRAQSATPEPVCGINKIVATAERDMLSFGIPCNGYVSREFGFLPSRPLTDRLPDDYSAWEEQVAALPESFAADRIRNRLDDMPVLELPSNRLSEPQLRRAICILGFLAHAYFHCGIGDKSPPLCVVNPWQQACRLAKRSQPFLSYEDLIASNWRWNSANANTNRRTVENLDLMFPVTGGDSERLFYLVQVEILYKCSDLPQTILRLEEALTNFQVECAAEQLRRIALMVESMTESLRKLTPDSEALVGLEPIIWAKTVAPFAVPIGTAVAPGPSGTASLPFHILDVLVGRKSYSSRLGRESKMIRKWMPQRHNQFLRGVENLNRSVLDSKPLQQELEMVRENYLGASGFLQVHRRKVYGFMEIAFRVGREVTIGGFNGNSRTAEWNNVDAELRASLSERPYPPISQGSSDRLCDSVVVNGRTVTDSELAQHSAVSASQWIAIDGEVFDISSFVQQHPGGQQVLMIHAGTDATKSFLSAHNSSRILNAFRSLVVGRKSDSVCLEHEHSREFCWTVIRWENTLAIEHAAISQRLFPAGTDKRHCHAALQRRLLTEAFNRATQQCIGELVDFVGLPIPSVVRQYHVPNDIDATFNAFLFKLRRVVERSVSLLAAHEESVAGQLDRAAKAFESLRNVVAEIATWLTSHREGNDGSQ